MILNQTDLPLCLAQMTALLAVELDEPRRAELQRQFSRIADMAEPLMAVPLDNRLEIAGVYRAWC